MKDTLRDLFTFSAGERKGIVVLILAIIVLGGINVWINKRHLPARQEDYPDWINDTGILSGPGGNVQPDPDEAREHLPVLASGVECFYFDPNSVSFEELQKLGFGARTSRTILNYRSKGGKFKTPEDLKKIFGLNPKQFNRISRYVRIREVPSVPKENTTLERKADKPVYDINHADSALLEKLPGIGPVLAKRIIKYRSLLGGYYCSQQLKEVYGISDSLYRKIMDRLVADTAALKKINLNTATEREIARHPYIGRYTASGIVRYRTQVTHIKNINELKINGLISGDVFDRIRYYLSI